MLLFFPFSHPYESVANFCAFFYVDLSPSTVFNPFFNGVSLIFLAMLLVDPLLPLGTIYIVLFVKFIIILKINVLTFSQCLTISFLFKRCFLTNGVFNICLLGLGWGGGGVGCEKFVFF
jgi:hypothetical protein